MLASLNCNLSDATARNSQTGSIDLKCPVECRTYIPTGQYERKCDYLAFPSVTSTGTAVRYPNNPPWFGTAVK